MIFQSQQTHRWLISTCQNSTCICHQGKIIRLITAFHRHSVCSAVIKRKAPILCHRQNIFRSHRESCNGCIARIGYFTLLQGICVHLYQQIAAGKIYSLLICLQDQTVLRRKSACKRGLLQIHQSKGCFIAFFRSICKIFAAEAS